jgi:hypothetical protein
VTVTIMGEPPAGVAELLAREKRARLGRRERP